MATGRNNGPANDDGNIPKKADIILRANQAIANKQDELIKQNKINNTRVEAMLENFSKGLQDTANATKQNGELVKQLQSENQALKQELLYIAKQNENIYSGLAERINALLDESKKRENAYAALADKVNDVCEQIRQAKDENYALTERLTVLTEENTGEGDYGELSAKISELAEKIEHIHVTAEDGVETVQLDDAFYASIADRIDDLSEQSKRSETVCQDLAYKMEDVCDSAKRSESVYSELSTKILDLSEQSKRSESAYTALSDKLDAVAMRVQLYGEESARAAQSANPMPAPVAYPTFVKEDVDYDKLAEKVADLVSAREVISPDYIASKVAEQIIVPAPEADSTNVNIKLDEGNIARQVADYLNLNGLNTNVTVDEEKIARHVAELINVNGVKVVSEDTQEYSSALDEEELADRIALKVGSLKAEDFEILVDDDGCSSISKSIADKLDYAAISEAVADKLRYALDLAQSEEPDYEEMAARISEKITVAGINEDAIADKAAAVLSNYLPDFDMDEISAKVTDAVIDVLNAQFANQPINTVDIDNEKLSSEISERLIESQAANDYDIVIDEDGISRMTVLVAEEVEKGTDARFNAIEGAIAEIKELLVSGDAGNIEVVGSAVSDERLNSIEEAIAELKGMLEEGVNANTDEVTEERFTKVEEAIAEIKEMLENGAGEGVVQPLSEERLSTIENAVAEIKEMLENGAVSGVDTIVEEHYNDERLNAIEDTIAEVKQMLENGGVGANSDVDTEERFNAVEQKIAEVKDILESGALVASAPVSEAAATAVEKQEEEPLLKVSEIISQPAPVIIPMPAPVEEAEEEEEDDDDKPEKDNDDSGDGEDLFFGEEGVDFSNMMKFNRSFIARIIQGTDEQKNFYGAVKQALLSYKKVNSNIAWGAERFNKGRETIARFKMRGKTLCLYLALDPNEYKVSVYHHLDASDNKSMSGTPMMVKIKSPLGVKKAIRLIDEMLAARDGVKRDLLERDYAAMYPYETIEELIEEGLVKDVRQKNKG